MIVKSWTDPEGRYTFAKVKIGNRSFCIGTVYAPMGPKRPFFLQFNCLLTEIGASQYLIGGDWNLVKDAILDRTGPIDTANNADRALLGDVVLVHGLNDHWRLTHSTDKEYTFFVPSTWHSIQIRLFPSLLPGNGSHPRILYLGDRTI